MHRDVRFSYPIATLSDERETSTPATPAKIQLAPPNSNERNNDDSRNGNSADLPWQIRKSQQMGQSQRRGMDRLETDRGESGFAEREREFLRVKLWYLSYLQLLPHRAVSWNDL